MNKCRVQMHKKLTAHYLTKPTMSRPFAIGQIFVGLYLFVCAFALQKPCGKNPMDDMDKLISNIMPFDNPNVKVPTNLEELPEFCRYSNAFSNSNLVLNFLFVCLCTDITTMPCVRWKM